MHSGFHGSLLAETMAGGIIFDKGPDKAATKLCSNILLLVIISCACVSHHHTNNAYACILSFNFWDYNFYEFNFLSLDLPPFLLLFSLSLFSLFLFPQHICLHALILTAYNVGEVHVTVDLCVWVRVVKALVQTRLRFRAAVKSVQHLLSPQSVNWERIKTFADSNENIFCIMRSLKFLWVREAFGAEPDY